MGKTKIEWSEYSWNPVTGCSKISEGCRNCYAERMAKRLAGRYGYPEAPHHFDVTLHPDRLDEPSHWKKPRMIFVVSMGDLLHEEVPLQTVLSVYNVAEDAPQHTYLWLTKRPHRALEFHRRYIQGQWLPNIWIGVTAENQKCADERIPILLQIPAAVRFVSCEPLLGPVEFWHDWLWPYAGVRCPRIDWAIAGGEGGPNARPMHPQWARDIRDQCIAANIPYFFKQWGEWTPLSAFQVEYLPPRGIEYTWPDAKEVYRVGKKVAGRLLDGREWNQLPNRINNGESSVDSNSVA